MREEEEKAEEQEEEEEEDFSTKVSIMTVMAKPQRYLSCAQRIGGRHAHTAASDIMDCQDWCLD